MNQILFRCDASSLIGSGHVMRCRTLARELRNHGAEAIFLCRQQEGDLIRQLEDEFPVLALPKQSLKSVAGLKDHDLYSAWLGCTQEQDAKQCLEILEQNGASQIHWLVVDHYGLDATWEEHILSELSNQNRPRLLVIDDLANRAHLADILLDQNFFGPERQNRYSGLIPKGCLKCEGPFYGLLGPEYSTLRPLIPARSGIRRLLVFFGGADQNNFTSRTLAALMHPSLAHLAVDVVIGKQSPYRQEVEALVESRPSTTLHETLPSLAGLMARADLAVGAGGSTTWERACLRLPSLIITLAANQIQIAKALHEAGYIHLIGNSEEVNTETIRSALISQVVNPVCQDVDQNLTDGFGASRIVLAMLGSEREIDLRIANASDEALLLNWANDPDVRARSFSPNPISESEHKNWFYRGMKDANRLLLIATTKHGCPIGQIRFDRKVIRSEVFSHEATIDLSLDRCARGQGLSIELVRHGLKWAARAWGAETRVIAEVHIDNQPSNKCFRRAGFVKESSDPANVKNHGVNRWYKEMQAY